MVFHLFKGFVLTLKEVFSKIAQYLQLRKTPAEKQKSELERREVEKERERLEREATARAKKEELGRLEAEKRKVEKERGRLEREARARARFFLDLAKRCSVEKLDEFEAYLEASIIFGRTAIHRLQSEHEHHSNWKPWWDRLRSDPAVEFLRNERNWILKKGPPKIGQIIGVGRLPGPMASGLYYYENPQTSATETVEKHLNAIEGRLIEAQSLFPSDAAQSHQR